MIVEDVGREAVEADDRVARRRRVVALVDDAGLLDDIDDRARLVIRDHAEVLGVGHLLHEHESTLVPLGDRLGLCVLEDVVAQADDELLAARELARHADDLRDPAGLHLHLVGEIELEERLLGGAGTDVPVAEQVDELPRVLLPGHEQHLSHPDALQELERVVDHRPPPHRQKVLVRHARQLFEPRCSATCADEPLHDGLDATAEPSSAPERGRQRRAGNHACDERRVQGGEEGQLDRRADPQREDECSHAHPSAEQEAGDEHGQLERLPA